MEITDIYIPRGICKKSESLDAFYEFYHSDASSIFWSSGDERKWRESLLNKADELNEPQLKEFLENHI